MELDWITGIPSNVMDFVLHFCFLPTRIFTYLLQRRLPRVCGLAHRSSRPFLATNMTICIRKTALIWEMACFPKWQQVFLSVPYFPTITIVPNTLTEMTDAGSDPRCQNKLLRPKEDSKFENEQLPCTSNLRKAVAVVWGGLLFLEIQRLHISSNWCKHSYEQFGRTSVYFSIASSKADQHNRLFLLSPCHLSV